MELIELLGRNEKVSAGFNHVAGLWNKFNEVQADWLKLGD